LLHEPNAAQTVEEGETMPRKSHHHDAPAGTPSPRARVSYTAFALEDGVSFVHVVRER
jgi:hypothetical protein